MRAGSRNWRDGRRNRGRGGYGSTAPGARQARAGGGVDRVLRRAMDGCNLSHRRGSSAERVAARVAAFRGEGWLDTLIDELVSVSIEYRRSGRGGCRLRADL